MTSTNVSIIVPYYNEEESLKELYQKIINQVQSYNYEILFINDGSTDNGPSIINSIIEIDKKVQNFNLRKNLGKSMALNIGFYKCTGDIILTLDADLQDDPDEIPHFIAKIGEGFDIVCGWRIKRNDPFEKKCASFIFNRIVKFFSKIDIHDFNCGFKAYKKKVIKTISIYGGMHRYVPIVAHEYGFKSGEIQVKHFSRPYGYSKYGVKRYFSGLFDFFSIVFLNYYYRRPLHFIGIPGIFFLLCGMALIFYTAFMKFGLGQTGVRPALMIGLTCMMLSLQVFLTGFVAELITFLFHKKRNYYEQYIDDVS